MSTYINGLNFRRNYFEENEVTKINVEQILEMKRQRLLERENENNNDILIKTLCDMKYNFEKSKCNTIKSDNVNIFCSCWYVFNEFRATKIQDNIESDGDNDLNLFNRNTLNRYRLFFNSKNEIRKFSDDINWDMFKTNDKVDRFLCEVTENDLEGDDNLMEDSALVKMQQENLSILKQYFDLLKTCCNDYLLSFLSKLCRSSISSFSMSSNDMALFYGIHNTTANDNRPIVFVVKYKCAIDFFLLPLLFKEAGIDSPIYFVGATKQVLNISSILNRIGYIIVRNSEDMKSPKIQSFVVEKKAEMILESKRSICLVLNDSINSYCSASDQKTEVEILFSAVNVFIDGKLNEPILVPLILSHEYIPRNFHLKSHSFWSHSWLKYLRMCTEQFGMVKLSICKPIYYSQFSSHSDESVNIADTDSQVKKLVRHLSMFSDQGQLIMPTHLVAFVLLYHFKEQKSVSILAMAKVSFDLYKHILSSESFGFEASSVITNIRRGCNMLSHCISVTRNLQSDSEDDYLISVDWNNFTVIAELDIYADVLVHKILMKSVAANAFVSVVKLSKTTDYIDQMMALSDSIIYSITNIVKILLSRFFLFHLPCQSLTDEISKLNSWWNETMISATRETEVLHVEGEYHSNTTNWFADVYDKRVKDQILILSRCIAPRLECLSFIIVELMQNKQSGFDSMIPVSELYHRFELSIRRAAKIGELRFKSCINYDYFVSGILTLSSHEIIRIIDLSTRERVSHPESIDYTSSRYAVLDSEYYNLQRWKTFIDLSLTAA